MTAGVAARALWRMSRPEQVLLIGVVYATGVAAGAAVHDRLDVTAVLWGLAALVPTAVSVHVVNEYADRETDALTRRTAFSGGSGALADLGVHPRFALRAAVAAGALALAVTACGLTTGGLPAGASAMLVVGLVGGWQYSVGPLRFSRRGLGEVANSVLGGLLLPLFGGATATGRLEAVDVLLFVPFALLDFVNLLETQWPDRVADRLAGKHTLVSRVSPGRVRMLAVVATVVAYGTAVVVLADLMLVAVAVASLVALPLSVWALTRITRTERPLPGVLAMVTFLLAQGAAWTTVAVVA